MTDAGIVQIFQTDNWPPLSICQVHGGQKYARDVRDAAKHLSPPTGEKRTIDHRTRIAVSALLKGHNHPNVACGLLVGKYVDEPDHPILCIDIAKEIIWVQDESPEFTWSFEQFSGLSDEDLDTLFHRQRGRFIKHKENA